MTGKPTTPVSRPTDVIRYASLTDLPVAPPISEATRSLSDQDIEQRAATDPDAGAVPRGFWDGVEVAEPDGTEQVTLRLPRRVLKHFRATGKGYQSRISAVLASYVDATVRRQGK